MLKIKKLLSVAVSIALIASLTACSKTIVAEDSASSDVSNASSSTDSAKFKAGTYEGVGQGMHGDLKVAVTLSNNEITAVEITEHNESPGISDPAIERIPAEIVKYQSIAVDVVAGATLTSNGILEGVTAALTAAGADIDSLKKAIEKTAGEAVEKEADVIIVGAGGAGLSAAMAAQKKGSSVIVIDKRVSAGGNTIISGAAYNTSDAARQANVSADAGPAITIENLIKAEPANDLHKQLQEQLSKEFEEFKASGTTGLFDSPTLHALQTFEGGDRVGNLDLIYDFTQKSLPTLDWMEDNGLGVTDEIFTVLGALWPRSHKPAKPLGTGYIDMFMEYCKNNNIEVMLETTASSFIMDGDKVVGVNATAADGGTVVLKAKKGVVLSTGGFAANIEMREKYNKENTVNPWSSLDEKTLTTNHPGATGDGIVMAEAINANLVGMQYIQLLPMGDPKTGSLSGNIEQGVDNRIFINKEGNRFVDEGQRRDVMTAALYDQTDNYMWVIVDSHSYPTGDVKNNFNESIDELIEAGRAFKGDTIEELAEKINVPAESFKKAIDDFNAHVDSKQVDEFGRTLYGNRIDTAPFYAGARIPTAHHTMGGVEIDIDCRVIDKSGKAIPGLYAAGEVAGGIHGTNRLGGNALPDAMVHGKIAGESAADQK